eukprot:TRINITY_DN20653_c0_g1_i3.p1 TRINITY_DN20653_c0_g1~~TRINITY_DN20653_c0_g1_i3.p1  ORF type:complete len:853 (+),score=200.10 TRINITY_DN20653_c0_g1_i3:262-2820(+)
MVCASLKDGLELCKQAVALLVGDIRAEVQQAVSVLRSEANAAGPSSRHGPATTKLIHVAESLQHAEKEALNKLRDLLKNSHWELGQRLDAQMQVNAQLGDQMQDSWVHILEVVNRLEVQMKRIEGRLKTTEENLTKDVSDVHDSLKNVSTQLSQESQQLQNVGKQTTADLESKLGMQMQETQAQLQEQMKVANNKVGKALQQIEDLAMDAEAKLTTVLDTQDALTKSAKQIGTDIHRMQIQDDKHYADLGFAFDTRMADQSIQLSNISSETNKFFEPVANDVLKIRRKVNDDTRLVLGEISRIQKALQVDYVKIAGTRSQAQLESLERSRTLDGSRYSKPDESDDRLAAVQVDEEDDVYNQGKRLRDYHSQTEHTASKDSAIQTDPIQFDMGGPVSEKKKKKKKEQTKEEEVKDKMKKAGFGGADKLKQQATAAAMKKQYNVFDHYWEDGCAQRIAKSPRFDNFTVFMVAINSIWIAVDTDLNKEPLLLLADPIFVIVENLFCTYFFTEIVIRFCAFQRKGDAFRDMWFVFDFCLVFIMVAETWLTPVVMLAAGIREGLPGGSNIIKMVRLARLLRLTRLTRLLRSFPELVIIIKGIAFAFRSVCIFFVLWMCIIYVGSILFKQLTEGTSVGSKLFHSVPAGINTLLIHGVFTANAGIMNEMTSDEIALWPLVVFFFALVSLTIMYMLLGVLVDVIGAVAQAEKQKLEISYIVENLREELEALGHKEDMKLTEFEFQQLVMEPGVVKVMQEAGVDVAVLADMIDLVWEDATKSSSEMSFPDLVNIVLNMRGTNPATVKDCKEQIRVTKTVISKTMEALSEELSEKIAKLRTDIQNIGDEEDSENEHDDVSPR